MMEFGLTPPSITSATSATLDAYKWDATTVTFTGTTHITTATGVNFIDIEAPTYTDSSALEIDFAATLAIKNAPQHGGSVTIDNFYAFWVQAGVSRFDDGVPILLAGSVDGGDQHIRKEGSGNLYIDTKGSAQEIVVRTNDTIRLEISGTGDVWFAGLGSPGGYVKAAASTGLLTSIAGVDVSKMYRPLQGTALTNADQTLQPFTDKVSEYVQTTALTVSRTKTLGTTTVTTGTLVRIVREDTAAFTLLVANGGGAGGTLFTFGASPGQKQGATFYYNGSDWVLVGFEYLTAS
jgi:hypothetical protein